MKEEAIENAAETVVESIPEVKVLTEGIDIFNCLYVDDYSKEVRRLRKKLRQIDELITKKEGGCELEYILIVCIM